MAIGAEFPSIFVWVRDNAGAWSQQAVFAHPDPSAPPFDQEFGSLLALNGDDLVVSGGALGGLLVSARALEISGNSVLVDAISLRLGTAPVIFALP